MYGYFIKGIIFELCKNVENVKGLNQIKVNTVACLKLFIFSYTVIKNENVYGIIHLITTHKNHLPTNPSI